ncbi:multicilin [Poecilia formosa]|uniref:multicilin n=1 Tax=Poecilia formosa TaxID=48698 RepID=UPI000443CF63|nr:PREDICTED: multicilin [Poecilia formosa]
MELMMETQKEGNAFGAVWPNRLGQRRGKAIDKFPVPRSSSPVSVYVEFPRIVCKGFATIEWGDLEGCASAVEQERNSFVSQANESDPDEQHYGDYVMDFIADSTAAGDSCLSELLPFQGCVIPPLTPQRDFSPEDSMVQSSTEKTEDGVSWRSVAECQGRALGDSMAINKQLQESLHKRQELDSLQERNLHLKQLASRAKHLASVLERFMTVRDSHAGEPEVPSSENTSLSPCKRQRLDEGYETESSDSVEDMLRDISTRCNAVLLSNAAGSPQESESIRMYGAFSSLQMSTPNSSSTVIVDAPEAAEDASSFRTSVREHGTIRTQVFPHGHAFTSRTLQGGYRFRWVPNHS